MQISLSQTKPRMVDRSVISIQRIGCSISTGFANGRGMLKCRAQAKSTYQQPTTSSSPLFTRTPTKISPALLILAISGATTGTLLDGIHSRVDVIVYDNAPLVLGGLHTSAFIPPLLAAFYVVLGGLVIYFDSTMDDPTTRGAVKGANLAKMVFSFGALAAMLELSAYLYSHNADSSAICFVLAFCAAINYLVFDSTKQGLALALLCALAAPLAELVLMQYFHVFHYPRGDLYTNVAGGIDRWVPFCYFFYCPALSNLTRYLMKVMS